MPRWRDAFGSTLGYFNEVYSSIGVTATVDKFEAETPSGSDFMVALNDLLIAKESPSVDSTILELEILYSKIK